MNRHLLNQLFRFRWTFVIVFAAGALVSVAHSLRQPDVYEVSATLLIDHGRENVYRSELGLDDDSYLSNDLESIVKAELQILRSRDVAEAVVDELGPTRLYPGLADRSENQIVTRNAAVANFLDALTVRGFDDSEIIQVSLEHGDPLVAYHATQSLLRHFRTRHLEVFGERAITHFLAERVAQYRGDLDTVESELQAFKVENLNFELDGERDLLVRQRQQLQQELKSAKAQAASLRNKSQSLGTQMQEVEKEITVSTEVDPSIARARERLLELQVEEKRLLGTYKESNRTVLNVREQIALVEQFLERNDSSFDNQRLGPNSVFADLERERIRTQADLTAQIGSQRVLQEQIAEVSRSLTQLTSREAEYRELERKRSSLEANLAVSEQRLHDAELSEQMDELGLASIKVVDDPELPLRPSEPNRRLLLIFGLAAAASLALGAALSRELLRPTLGEPELAAQVLDLPILATIPARSSGSET